MFIDSHCHLEMLEDIPAVINRARKAGVKIIVYNSVNFETMKKALELSKHYHEIKVALGIYPIDALKLTKDELEAEIDFIRQNKKNIIAIGEVGIDLMESNDLDGQKDIFLKFVNLSKELYIPLIIHSRKAEEKVIEILEKEGCKRIVMHCFCGNFKLVDKIVKNNWMINIPTNVTFSSHFQKIVERVPIQNMLCETDSPFLHPIKGERNNEPANVIESYKKIAEIKGLKLLDVEKQIEENFNLMF